MSLIKMDQPVTRWPGSRSAEGSITFGTPILMHGRVEIMNEKFISSTGQECTSKAIFYLTKDIAINDWIAEGDYVTPTISGNPVMDPTTIGALAYAVRQFTKIPDLRNTEYERKAFI